MLSGWCVLIFLIVTAVYHLATSTLLDMNSGQVRACQCPHLHCL